MKNEREKREKKTVGLANMLVNGCIVNVQEESI